MPHSVPKSQKWIGTTPAVQHYLSACAVLIEHMRKGEALTEIDLDLLKQITTSMQLLLPAWERQHWGVDESCFKDA
jgi:hypothetical protein